MAGVPNFRYALQRQPTNRLDGRRWPTNRFFLDLSR